MVDFVKINGKEIPAKFNPRAKSYWEKATGLIWSNLFRKENPIIPTTEQSMILCLEVLREGHRRNKSKTKFNVTLDQVYDWADDYDLETQITDLIFGTAKEEKK